MYIKVNYPAILGYDLAGTVIEVGPNVTRFRVGDRVLAPAIGLEMSRNRAAEGAFQLHTILSEQAASLTPEGLSFADAAVIPLGLSSVATALCFKGLLNLSPPSLSPEATGKTVLVWGDSTSVGLDVIQLAVAAGYEVNTPCSPRNFPLVKSLGAAETWDYNDLATIAAITKQLSSQAEGSTKPCAGSLTIGEGSIEACLHILGALPSASTNKFVGAAAFPVQPPTRYLATVKLIYNSVSWNTITTWKGWCAGVKWKLFLGTALITDETELSEKIYGQLLAEALKQGNFMAVPQADIVSDGFAALQGGMEKVRNGVSARKAVVTL